MMYDSSAPEYARATRPHNTVTQQHPRLVAAPTTAAEVSEAMAAAEHGLTVVPQATGHGAGAPVGDDALLLDTSGLASVSIDAEAKTATVGSGATWAAVNAAAFQQGLLGPAGSAGTVSTSGYSFAGGIGWLVRRDGLASGAIRRVGYVDGLGRSRVASDDAREAVDRDALWAFRGAGGVGVATELEIDLFPASALHAGRLLWPGEALETVAEAWAGSLSAIGPSVSSSLALIHLTAAPVVPAELRGRVAILLSVADPDGGDGAQPLLSAVRAAAHPLADDWGPADAARLAQIHLDPPDPVPALGDARWLEASALDLAPELLRTAHADDSPIVMMELRHVGGAAARRPGALTEVVAPLIYHAVGPLGRSTRPQLGDAFARAREVWGTADAGLAPGAWRDGAASVPDALPAPLATRARAIADEVDPLHRIRRSRILGGPFLGGPLLGGAAVR